MKKLLLSTTAVAAFAFATEAEANSLQVNVGGFVDFQAGYVSDDVVGDTATNSDNEINFNTDSEIHFIIEGKADNGLEYGAVVELEANVGGQNSFDAGDNADKAYVYLQGGWGRLEGGENKGAEEALAVDTANFASGTGGVDGDFFRFAAIPTNFNGAFKPALALEHAGNNAGGFGGDTALDEDATKLTYYSPRFSGFQVGVSYIPNSGDTSRTTGAPVIGAGFTDATTGVTGANAGFEDVFTGGINFTDQFDGIGVAASLTGITGEAVAAGDDLEGFQVGLNLSAAGFTIGGSYGDQELSSAGVDVESDFFDIGVGYAAGPWSVSATYIDAETEFGAATDEFENFVLGADYQLAPGLVPYAEVSFFEFDGGAVDGTGDNEGTVVILGTELTF